jgi:hypothetical protein
MRLYTNPQGVYVSASGMPTSFLDVDAAGQLAKPHENHSAFGRTAMARSGEIDEPVEHERQ